MTRDLTGAAGDGHGVEVGWARRIRMVWRRGGWLLLARPGRSGASGAVVFGILGFVTGGPVYAATGAATAAVVLLVEGLVARAVVVRALDRCEPRPSSAVKVCTQP
jgi:hypothetical protein